jgi:hypothetical protein
VDVFGGDLFSPFDGVAGGPFHLGD